MMIRLSHSSWKNLKEHSLGVGPVRYLKSLKRTYSGACSRSTMSCWLTRRLLPSSTTSSCSSSSFRSSSLSSTEWRFITNLNLYLWWAHLHWSKFKIKKFITKQANNQWFLHWPALLVLDCLVTHTSRHTSTSITTSRSWTLSFTHFRISQAILSCFSMES
jgi:hypothetical protein